MSRGQVLKRERVRRDHVPQRVDEQVRPAPAIKAKGHFLKVGG